MPQHTSTRQSPGTPEVAGDEVLPPDAAEKTAAKPGAADSAEEAAAPAGPADVTEPPAGATTPVSEPADTDTDMNAAADPEAEAEPGPEIETERQPGPAEAELLADTEAAEAAEPAPAPTAPAPEADPGPDPAPGPQPGSLRAKLTGLPGVRRVRGWRGRYPVAARVLAILTTVLAVGIVVVALVLPNKEDNFRTAQFTRIPVEALLGAAVLIAVPRRPRLVLAVLGGLSIGVLTVLNLLDVGFNEYLGRGFNPLLDWPLLTDAQSYVADTIGGTGATLASIGVVLLVVLLLAVTVLAVVRVGNVLGRQKSLSTRVLLVLCAVWMTAATLNISYDGVPVSSEHTVAMLKYREQQARATYRDEREFTKTAKVDAFGNTPGSQLVPDLRGKDVIFTFIESYGRSAIEDPVEAPGVDSTLDASTAALKKAGFAAKSGWLTSATYGGSSWLGHSTTMSGLWINNQNRYRTVTASDHLTLTKAFQKTGDWDTVGVMPGVQKAWPESKWYGLDKVYNAFQTGYKGPKFSWSTQPDQYALEAFQRLVHGKKRTDGKPLMSLVILTSSHQPWAPIPKMVPWDQLGDGSIFDAIEKAGNKPTDIVTSSTKSQQEYGKSVQYSVTSLTQWMERYGNKNTVLVFLGDHQPIARVSGSHASRDVPISIVAKDPKVLAKIGSWNWSDGLRPAHDAPVWKMSDFRDKFLTAYGSTPHPSKG
ncbi:CDP-alcohol phosphatidyltransferase [Streptomyces sp. NPDC005423]|uniref:CDP-alcohol phosphatidyltransferase n=1 Tax=Streptomyces sp. NPDC005423 TaxID=3155343 RepID=UPI0033A44C57